MGHPFLDEVQNIVDMGVASVSTHRQELSQLKAIAADLQSKEQAFYSQINFNGQKVHSAADLNRVIQSIDKDLNIGSLLPRGLVENQLSYKYI